MVNSAEIHHGRAGIWSPQLVVVKCKKFSSNYSKNDRPEVAAIVKRPTQVEGGPRVSFLKILTTLLT